MCQEWITYFMALLHIIANAVKFSPKNKEVTVKFVRKDNAWQSGSNL